MTSEKVHRHSVTLGVTPSARDFRRWERMCRTGLGDLAESHFKQLSRLFSASWLCCPKPGTHLQFPMIFHWMSCVSRQFPRRVLHRMPTLCIGPFSPENPSCTCGFQVRGSTLFLRMGRLRRIEALRSADFAQLGLNPIARYRVLVDFPRSQALRCMDVGKRPGLPALVLAEPFHRGENRCSYSHRWEALLQMGSGLFSLHICFGVREGERRAFKSRACASLRSNVPYPAASRPHYRLMTWFYRLLGMKLGDI